MAVLGKTYINGGLKIGNYSISVDGSYYDGSCKNVLRWSAGNSGNCEHNCNNIASNGVWYYNTGGPSTSLGATTNDGALYSQAYSSEWVGEIAQDYRNGRLFVRGKNSNNWTDWKRIANYEEKVNKSGDTMSGGLTFSASTPAIAASTPTALSYGRLQSYGTFYINADTDNSSSEYILLTAGHGLSTTVNDGLKIGQNDLTWQGTSVSLSNHNHDGAYVNVTGDTMTGQLIISNSADADQGNLNAPLIIGDIDGSHILIDNNEILSVSNRSLKDLWLNGAYVDSTGGVHGAVWNDLVDKIIVPEDTKLEYGKCFYTDGKEYKQTNRYCQKGIIGIHSDTFGFSMGNVENKTQLNVSVSGFVLAFTDKKYKSGTPLTCTKDGYLTKISLWDKIIYPERIVGTYWKDETQDEWNGIKVNNRNWIKIK